MLNLVIYISKPIRINEEILELVSIESENTIILKYKGKYHVVNKSETIQVEPNVLVNYYTNYKQEGISLGIICDKEVSLRRCVGYSKDGRPLWYSRKEDRRCRHNKGTTHKDSLSRRCSRPFHS